MEPLHEADRSEEDEPLNDSAAPASAAQLRRYRRCSLALLTLGLATLALVGVSLQRSDAKPQAGGGASPKRWGKPLEKWEQLPGIDEHIARAAALPLKPGEHAMSLRELQAPDRPPSPSPVPYRDDPDKGLLGQMQTQCFLDVENLATQLGNSVVYMYWALHYDGMQCPDNTEAGCAVSITFFVTGLAWIANYISMAASSCAETVNPKAVCAADWTAVVGDMGAIVGDSIAASGDCKFDSVAKPPDPPGFNSSAGTAGSGGVGARPIVDCSGNEATLPRKAQLQCKLQRVQEKLDELKKQQEARRSPLQKLDEMAEKATDARHRQTMRDFDVAQCAFDISWAVTYIVRVVLQLRTAAAFCDDHHVCAVNVLNVISSFAWIGEYITLAVSDCMEGSDQQALCAGEVIDMFAATTNLASSGAAIPLDCQADTGPQEVGQHITPSGDRRLASQNVRR